MFSFLKSGKKSPEKEFTERKMLQALTDRVALSQFMTYMTYDDKTDFTLYETIEGVGIIFECHTPPYLGDEYEEYIKQVFRMSYPEGTIINMMCYASRNVKPYIDKYIKIHSNKANVDNPDLLLEIIKKRAELYLEASEEGFWKGVKFMPRIFKNYVSFLIPYTAFKNDIEECHKFAESFAQKAKGLLQGSRISVSKVDPHHLKTLLKEIFNPAFEGTCSADDQISLRNQVIDKDTIIKIEEDNEGNTNLHFIQKNIHKYAKVYTVSKYPRQMSLFDFNNLFFAWDSREISPSIPTPFIISLNVKISDWQKKKAKLSAKTAWNLHNAENNWMSKYVSKIQKKAEEAKYINDLLEDGAIPLSSYLTFIFFEENPTKLDYVSYDAVSRLQAKGFELTREIDKAMLGVFLETLPINHIDDRDRFSARRKTMFDLNLPSFTPFISGVAGCNETSEMYVDRKGALVFFDRFASPTNYNVSVVAESGGGKSFSRGNSHIHSLTAGRRIRVIDIGRSYEPLCKDIGGEYIEITMDRNPCFNFFTNIVTDENGNIHEDEMDSIVPMVGFLCGVDVSKQIAKSGEENLTARQASIIIDAITKAFYKKGHEAGMADVAEAMLEIGKHDPVGDKLAMKLYQSIEPYANGIYAHYFNGPNNITYSKDYVVLELEEVEQKDSRLQAAIIFSLIINVLREVFINWKNTRGAKKTEVDVDEAWSIFEKVSAKEAINSFARRFRKYESSLCIITQGIADMYINETTEAIWNNSAHKIYLQMPQAQIEKAIEEKKLTMDGFSKEWFKTLATQKGMFSEIYFDSPSAHGVVRLVTDKFSYGVLTTTGSEKKQIQDLAQKWQMNIKDVLKLLTEKKPLTQVYLELGVPPLAVEMAEIYKNNYDGDGKDISDILKEMGIIDDTLIQKALKYQEDQLTWEKVFRK